MPIRELAQALVQETATIGPDRGWCPTKALSRSGVLLAPGSRVTCRQEWLLRTDARFHGEEPLYPANVDVVHHKAARRAVAPPH